VLFRFRNLDLNHRINFFPFFNFFLFLTFYLLSLSFFSPPSTSFLCLLSCRRIVALLPHCLLVVSLHYLLALPYALHVASHVHCLIASCICHLVALHARYFVVSRVTSLPRYFITTLLPLLHYLISSFALPHHATSSPRYATLSPCHATFSPHVLPLYLVVLSHYHRMLSSHVALLPFYLITLLVGISLLLLEGGAWKSEFSSNR
jgi:hypothetical protein